MLQFLSSLTLPGLLCQSEVEDLKYRRETSGVQFPLSLVLV